MARVFRFKPDGVIGTRPPNSVQVMAAQAAIEVNLARGAEVDIGHAPDRVPNRIGHGDQRVSFRTTQ